MTLIPVPPTGPFATQEDDALKLKLSGWQVSNYNQNRPGGIPTENVAVYYRFPDPEIRTRTFPSIVIDLIDIEAEDDREHRAGGYIVRPDLELATPLVNQSLVSDDMPLPWSLIYQLSAYSRQPWHDRQLSVLLYQLFPQKFGFLDMTNFDGTVRRADLRGVTRRDTVDSNQKRLFRNIFTVAVSAELYLYQVQSIMQVLEVNVDFLGNVSVP